MRAIIFDTGPIITFTMNNLLWLLEPLKASYKGNFYITPAVKFELVDKPLQTKKFKFEALQVLKYISKGVLEVIDTPEINDRTNHLMNLANSALRANDHDISIVHCAEMQAVAAAACLGADAIVIDERTVRSLIEDPEALAQRMERKLHTTIRTDPQIIDQLKRELQIPVLRSVELATIAFEHGLLDLYLTEAERSTIPHINRTLLESVLWGLKLNGCAVSEDEIEDIIKLEIK